jgi:hypothetical protein
MGAVLGLSAAVLMPAGTAQALPDCGAGGQVFGYGPTGSILECEITSGGTYAIYVFGANGGAQVIDLNPEQPGGKGAGIGAVFQLNLGDLLNVLIGIDGAEHAGEWKSEEIYAGGGGGGTFVTLLRGSADPVPLLIGGGGGGAGTASDGQPGRGLEGTPHEANGNGEYGNGGAGGLNGSGGGAGDTATGGAGGGGFYGDGGGSGSATGGLSFMNGGAGGVASPAEFCFGASGGYGGGGAAAWTDCTEDGGPGGGGGGGYSGGGGGGWDFWGNDGGAGGGGSSYYNPDYYVNGLLVQPGSNPFTGGGWFQIQQVQDSEGNPVPEPGTLAVLGVALGALAWRRRR